MNTLFFVLDPLQCKKAATLFIHFTVQTCAEFRWDGMLTTRWQRAHLLLFKSRSNFLVAPLFGFEP